jgi:cytidylate kinase
MGRDSSRPWSTDQGGERLNQSKQHRRIVVAIDGPAGAGKSTVSRRVSEELGYTRVDTGALYRAVAWFCQSRGVELRDAPEVGKLARALAEPGALTLSTSGPRAEVQVMGQRVTDEIRSRRASLGASVVSQNPEVREALLAMQRALGAEGGVVLDIGSVVFPKAEAKFYLTASSLVRATRRRDELSRSGTAPELEAIIEEVNERDRRDTERPIAPLMLATDAEVIDSSELDIEQVVARLVARVRELEVT